MARRANRHRQEGEGARGASVAPALMWFRDDLRLSDNIALTEAAGRKLIALYVLDDETPGPDHIGGAQRWWLHHSLASLAADLRRAGIALVLRRGRSADVVAAVVDEIGAHEVHATRSTLPWLQAVDKKLDQALSVPFHRHAGATLVEVDALRAGSGKPYQTYSPFARAARAMGVAPPLGVPALEAAETIIDSEALEDWDLLPTAPDWAGGLRATWQPGEAGALKRIEAFVHDGLATYDRTRDIPGDTQGSSMLSPHLRWGEVSPRQVWHAVADHETSGARYFRNEMLWRDFAASQLLHCPQMPRRALRGAFEQLRWRRSPTELAAWQRGQSGIPIVDAGMRQLWQTGWMHNRVRMIAASWLVKHLLLDWRAGEAWFWDTLVDGDLASNSANWQWVAGTGTEAQPFFRIFNPVLQAKRFDGDGRYVRHWVPEVAELPDRWLHQPWLAPQATLDRAGLRLGRDYPRPAIDIAAGRERALGAYQRDVRGRTRDDAA